MTLPDGENWLATQVPIFAVETLLGDKLAHDGNVALRADDIPKPSAMMLAAWTAWRKNPPTTSPLARIFSGDLHLMQVIRPRDQPSQITIGTGGVKLDPLPVPKGIPEGSRYEFDDDYVLSDNKNDAILRVDAKKGCSDRRNGYLLAQIKGPAPHFEFRPLWPSGSGCAF